MSVSLSAVWKIACLRLPFVDLRGHVVSVYIVHVVKLADLVFHHKSDMLAGAGMSQAFLS